ncbi:GNAT family N-acetyltransferase [Arcanobacterium hippocoleae]
MKFNFGEGAKSAFWMLEVGARALPPHTDVLYRYFGEDVAIRLTQTALSYPENAKVPQYVLNAFGIGTAGVAELEKVAEKYPRPDLTMIDQRIFQALPLELKNYYGPCWGEAWEFFYALNPISEVSQTTQVARLPAGSEETIAALAEIEKVLRKSIKESHALNQMEHFDWFVHRLPNGTISAAMGVEADAHPDPQEYQQLIGMDLRQALREESRNLDKSRVRSVHFAGLGADPQYRGKGFGTAVMVAAINWHLENGYDFIRFGMWDWNHRARSLYQRLGISANGKVILGRAQKWR